jgi:hypothetical protein
VVRIRRVVGMVLTSDTTETYDGSSVIVRAAGCYDLYDRCCRPAGPTRFDPLPPSAAS